MLCRYNDSNLNFRLKFDQYVNTVPTIGFNCERVRGFVGRSRNLTFLIWDVGGQEKLRPLWKPYTRATDAIVFVVDSCESADRMEEAKLELLKIWKSNSSIPVLILANKQDLPSALDVAKIESLLGLKELGSSYHWHIQPTCAITGEGLDEGIEKFHELILNRRKLTRNGVSKSGLAKAAAAKNSRKVQRSHSHHY